MNYDLHLFFQGSEFANLFSTLDHAALQAICIAARGHTVIKGDVALLLEARVPVLGVALVVVVVAAHTRVIHPGVHLPARVRMRAHRAPRHR